MTRGLADKAKKLRDDAIVGEALNLHRFTSEDVAKHLPAAIERWNKAARWLDRLYGFGLQIEQANAVSFRFKPLYPGAWKRALAVLWLLCDEQRTSDRRRLADLGFGWLQADLDWMLEFMVNSGLPADKIKWEATARQGAWNVRLRKTKINIAAQQAAVFREALADLKQDQLNQFRRELFRRHAELDQLVATGRKIDPTDLDLYAVNWPHHIVGHRFGLGVLVPINEPHVIVEPLVADDDPATE